MNTIEINIFAIVGDDSCVNAEDGQKVFGKIKEVIEAGHKAKLSFTNVSLLTSAFLNVAIGQLYGLFDDKKLRDSLSVENITEDDKSLLKKVIDNAKLFYSSKDKKGLEKIYDEAVKR